MGIIGDAKWETNVIKFYGDFGFSLEAGSAIILILTCENCQ